MPALHDCRCIRRAKFVIEEGVRTCRSSTGGLFHSYGILLLGLVDLFFFWGGGGIEVTEELCIICTSYSLPEWQAITNILAP